MRKCEGMKHFFNLCRAKCNFGWVNTGQDVTALSKSRLAPGLCHYLICPHRSEIIRMHSSPSINHFSTIIGFLVCKIQTPWGFFLFLLVQQKAKLIIIHNILFCIQPVHVLVSIITKPASQHSIVLALDFHFLFRVLSLVVKSSKENRQLIKTCNLPGFRTRFSFSYYLKEIEEIINIFLPS